MCTSNVFREKYVKKEGKQMNQSGLLHDLSRLSSQSQSAAVLKVKAEEIPTVSAYSPGILEFVNYHLSSLIMFENVKKKKIDGSFSYLWDFYKVFFPCFSSIYKSMNAD